MSEDQKQLESYLKKLEAALSRIPVAERSDILLELNAHIQESLSQGRTIEDVLSGLGDPETVAKGYLEDFEEQDSEEEKTDRIPTPPAGGSKKVWLWGCLGCFGVIVLLVIGSSLFFRGLINSLFLDAQVKGKMSGPLIHVDEKNERVKLFGGVIDIDGKAEKVKVGDLIDIDGKKETVRVGNTVHLDGKKDQVVINSSPTKSTVYLSRKKIEEFAENREKTIMQARVVPYFLDGKMNGFKFYKVAPKGIYGLCTIRRGDILKVINGKVQDTIKDMDLLNLADILLEKGELTLVVSRNQKDHTIIVRLAKDKEGITYKGSQDVPSSDATLEIEGNNGKLSFEISDDNKVHYNCLLNKGANFEAIRKTDSLEFDFKDNSFSQDCEFKVPAELPLEVETMNGKILISGRKASTKAELMNGRIEFVKAKGENYQFDAEVTRGKVSGIGSEDGKGHATSLSVVNGKIDVIDAEESLPEFKVTLPKQSNFRIKNNGHSVHVHKSESVLQIKIPGHQLKRFLDANGGDLKGAGQWTPHFADGKFQGFKMVKVERRSPFSIMNLHEGDLILHKETDVELKEIHRKLLLQKSFALDVIHEGTKLTYEYEMFDMSFDELIMSYLKGNLTHTVKGKVPVKDYKGIYLKTDVGDLRFTHFSSVKDQSHLSYHCKTRRRPKGDSKITKHDSTGMAKLILPRGGVECSFLVPKGFPIEATISHGKINTQFVPANQKLRIRGVGDIMVLRKKDEVYNTVGSSKLKSVSGSRSSDDPKAYQVSAKAYDGYVWFEG